MKVILALTLVLAICAPNLAFRINTRLSDLRTCLEETHSRNVSFVEPSTNPALYQRLNYQFNIRLAEVLPLAYVVPKSTEDVQVAIKCGRALNYHMIAKSGGHSYEKFSFGNSSSVIIDLRELTTINVDPSSKTVDVGAGNLIGHLYWALWENGGFGIQGPDCVSIGVGGFSLGGGHGYWGKRYGLTTDAVLEMDFVDSNGDLHLVNQETNSDLFWALRGAGGGNFGIVTRFKYRIFDASALNVTHITLTYALDQYRESLKAYMSYIHRGQGSSTYTRYRVTGPETIEINFVDADLSEADIEEIKTTFPSPNETPISIISMNFIELYAKTAVPPVNSPSQLGRVSRESLRYSYRAKSYYSSNPLNELDINSLEPILTRVPQGIWIDWSSLGGQINRVPSNATAYVHRNSLAIIQVGIYVQDQASMEWVDDIDFAARRIMDNGESYQNYIDATLRDENYLTRYYGENLGRLVEIKRRIDPDNYFSYPMSIPLSHD